MYSNLLAEIARNRLTQSALAELAGIKNSTFAFKMKQKDRFTLKQAFDIKKALNIDMPLEELFHWVD